MRIRWYGQSAFRLEGEKSVVIDPFGDFSERMASRGITWEYAPVEMQSADLLLITHEHADHTEDGRLRAAIGPRVPADAHYLP